VLFGRPLVKRFALCYRTVKRTVIACLSCLSVTLVYCGQTVGWIRMPLGTEVGLGPGHIVLDGDPAPLPIKGAQPLFSAHVCCGQTAGWIKMHLGKEVSLGSGDTVLDGDPVLPPKKKRHSSHPVCGLCLLWPNVRPSQQLLSSC